MRPMWLCVFAVNKDLYGLLMRVKAVYAICGGGNDSIKVDKKTMRDFDYKKTMLIQRLFQLEEVRQRSCDAHACSFARSPNRLLPPVGVLDSAIGLASGREHQVLTLNLRISARECSSFSITIVQMAVAKGAIEKSLGGHTTRDTIRMKLQMDSDLNAVEGELKSLGAIAAADDGKGKLSAAELTARKEILETLKTEYYKVYERVSGHKHRGDKSFEQGGVGMPTLSKEALTKGAFAGAGVKVEREALTGAWASGLTSFQMYWSAY